MLHHQSRATKRSLHITPHPLKSPHTSLLHQLSLHTNHHLQQRLNTKPHLHPRQLISLPHKSQPSLNTVHPSQALVTMPLRDQAIPPGPDPAMDHLLSLNQATDLLLSLSQAMDLPNSKSQHMALQSSNMAHQSNNIGQDQTNNNSKSDHRTIMAHQNSNTMPNLQNMLHPSNSLQRSQHTKSQNPNLAIHHQSQAMDQSRLLKSKILIRLLQNLAMPHQPPNQATLLLHKKEATLHQSQATTNLNLPSQVIILQSLNQATLPNLQSNHTKETAIQFISQHLQHPGLYP